MTTLVPGGKFGDYTVVRLLGKGGMGEVWLLQSPSGLNVAVKILNVEAADSHKARRRFLCEAKLAQGMRHPHLVKTYDVGEDPETGLCYILMEYMPGGTLADRIAANGAMPIEDAVAVLQAIADALELVRAKGIVHRDIKPANIMFAADGTPKLADLGIARAGSRDAGITTTITQTGVIIGTPAYMAPEQMLDSHRVDTRADIYSLGVVFFEMLTGERPNKGDTIIQLMAKAMKGEPLPDVRTLRPEVPEPLSRLFALMTMPDIKKRVRTPGKVAAAINAFRRTKKLALKDFNRPLLPPVVVFLGLGVAFFVIAITFSRFKSPDRRQVQAAKTGEIDHVADLPSRPALDGPSKPTDAKPTPLTAVKVAESDAETAVQESAKANPVATGKKTQDGQNTAKDLRTRHATVNGLTWCYTPENGKAVIERGEWGSSAVDPGAWQAGPSDLWFVEWDKALAEARKTGKRLFVLNTGYDWCHWCRKLRAEVLDKPEFVEFATQNLVPLYLDSPRRNPHRKEQRAHNREIVKALGFGGGVPSAEIFTTDGRRLGRIGGGGLALGPYLDRIRQALSRDGEPVDGDKGKMLFNAGYAKLAATIAEERAKIPPATKNDFKALLTGVAVCDAKTRKFDGLRFLPPTTHLEVAPGKIAVFRVEHDFPKGYAAAVWVTGKGRLFSNPSRYHPGKGVKYGFLGLHNAEQDVRLDFVDIRTNSEPELDDHPRGWTICSPKVDIVFSAQAAKTVSSSQDNTDTALGSPSEAVETSEGGKEPKAAKTACSEVSQTVCGIRIVFESDMTNAFRRISDCITLADKEVRKFIAFGKNERVQYAVDEIRIVKSGKRSDGWTRDGKTLEIRIDVVSDDEKLESLVANFMTSYRDRRASEPFEKEIYKYIKYRVWDGVAVARGRLFAGGISTPRINGAIDFCKSVKREYGRNDYEGKLHRYGVPRQVVPRDKVQRNREGKVFFVLSLAESVDKSAMLRYFREKDRAAARREISDAMSASDFAALMSNAIGRDLFPVLVQEGWNVDKFAAKVKVRRLAKMELFD